MRETRNSIWTGILCSVLATCAASGAAPVWGGAHSAHQRATAALHIELTIATTCAGTMNAAVNMEKLTGTTWAPVQDDGHEDIQIRDGNTGPWISVQAASGGEDRLRWPRWQQFVATHHIHDNGTVRLIRTDGSRLASSPKPFSDNCQE